MCSYRLVSSGDEGPYFEHPPVFDALNQYDHCLHHDLQKTCDPPNAFGLSTSLLASGSVAGDVNPLLHRLSFLGLNELYHMQALARVVRTWFPDAGTASFLWVSECAYEMCMCDRVGP